ncbi:SUN domain-containing ossification factor isoform X3 [Salmo trutta]|uniref:SUN domain containing ossification factor n=1 Tax=Salmo trutta TaxID=8032 RepID=A0A673YG04_SALTR|nr:SUN domain-containing ossification factor-like isoform X3 [Salmo trutta]
MKRLRVLLACLILWWYPSRNVCCSEHSSSAPGVSRGESSLPEHHHEQYHRTDHKEESSRTHTHTYDVELETKTATLEEPNTHNTEQTVNQEEPVVVWSAPEPHLDPEPPAAAAAEPHSHNTHLHTHIHTDPEPDTQPTPLQNQAPAPSSPSTPPLSDDPTQGQTSTDHTGPVETPSDAPADPSPAPSTEDPQHTPTSTIPAPAPSSSIEVARSDPAVEDSPVEVASAEADPSLAVASAGSNSSLEGNVFADLSGSQCGMIPHNLATQTPPFGSSPASGDGDSVESQSEQGQSQVAPGSDADVQESLSPEDPDQGLPELDQGGNTSHRHQDTGQDQQAVDEAVDASGKETDPSVPSKEDIPTFDEWKKQVMEVEKEKTLSLHTSSSGSPPVKKVQKNFKNNYASVECGAKMLSANTEAKSTSAILMENMDLYMLNPCSNKIWFVIELCEPIQVKQLDIANFELFSSTPKDFLVSISDRYPTNKWVKLGTFHARDERTVQSFPLDEQLYAKYVKVELISHFGSEHFCPLSLIRVFGTSMVEEYEEIADSQYPSERLEYLDEDYDYPPGYLHSEDKGSKNLLGSATNAILNMVNNIAANVLGGKPEDGGAQLEPNASSEAQNQTEGNKEVLLTPTPTITTPPPAMEPDHPAPQEDPDLALSSPDSPLPNPSPEDGQIVTLVVEEEEPRQSTVTLMEEEGDDDEEREVQWMRESQLYCPLSSVSSVSSISCAATLPELLRRWCDACLTRERERGLRKRQQDTYTHTPIDTPLPTHTTIQDPVPAATHTQEAPTHTEPVPDPETAPRAQNEVLSPTDSHNHTDTHPVDPIIVLEPSRTSTLPPHSFSHTSLSKPTPTQDEAPRPPSQDDPVPPPALQGAPVPEAQQASIPNPSPSPTTPLHPPTSETASLDLPPLSLKEQPVQPLPTASRPADIPPPTELPVPLQPDTHAEPHTPRAGVESGDLKGQGEQGDSSPQPAEHPLREESMEDLLLSVPVTANGHLHRTATDFYAELQSTGEYIAGNGGVNGGVNVHGSSQKESVFMRLNNRIKALEMNMSLSSRYLEELSQRYRKQMEEMQRAFNKTIIKLQNTSRIAGEQDQRQTESIQMLQGQLENVTKLMINLTMTVSQLQKEVSDRQSYLVVSLVLCLCLGLVFCLQCCRSANTQTTTHTAVNHYPSPKRCFSSYEDMSLKRRISCPLVRSKSFTFPTSEVGPDDLYIVEPLRFSPEKKKKRCKLKAALSAPSSPVADGALECNGLPHSVTPPPPPPPPILEDISCKELHFPSESCSGSSSTHSEESYISRGPPLSSPPCMFNGHAALPNPLCLPSLPPSKKRSAKRQRSRQVELRLSSRQTGGAVNSLPSLQQLIKENKEISVGTIGPTAITGHV